MLATMFYHGDSSVGIFPHTLDMDLGTDDIDDVRDELRKKFSEISILLHGDEAEISFSDECCECHRKMDVEDGKYVCMNENCILNEEIEDESEIGRNHAEGEE